MRRVAAGLEGVELVLQYQGQLAQQTELVRSRDDHPSPGPGQSGQFPDERTGVLQVLDRLHGHHHIPSRIRQRSPTSIQVDSVELDLIWQAIIANYVDPNVSVEPGTEVTPQVAGPAPDVDEDAAAGVTLGDGIGDRSVDRVTTDSQALPGAGLDIK